MLILVVEDDMRLADLIRRGLREEGYAVELARDGKEGEMLAMANSYDLFIIDWRLPYQDGRTLVEKLRSSGRSGPVLMLTALGDIEYKIAGLDAGADDYLTKPFSFEELFARLRALRRRYSDRTDSASILETGPLRINSVRMEAFIGKTDLNLRTKEFQLLTFFAQNEGKVLTRTIIAERIWGSAYVTDNVIGVTVSGIRQKLEEAQACGDEALKEFLCIETVRGIGYRMIRQTNSNHHR